MRIAFLGKGGSGKTTISGSFANFLQNLGQKTFYVDADINSHSHEMLQIKKENVKSLDSEKIIDFVIGERKDIPKEFFLGITPPTENSNLIKFSDEEFLSQISAESKNGIKYFSIGNYSEKEIATTCYHGKSEVLNIFLNHLDDKKDEYLVVDSVTGIDNIGNTLIFSYDLNIFIVEPTKKSLRVFEDFMNGLGKIPYSPNFLILGNKVNSSEDENFLKENIPAEKYIGSLKYSEKIKEFEKGNYENLEEFIGENKEVFEKLKQKLDEIIPDKKGYAKNILANYILEAESYYNNYFGVNLVEKLQIGN